MPTRSDVRLDRDVVQAVETILRANLPLSSALTRYHFALADILKASCEAESDEDEAMGRDIWAAIKNRGVSGALIKVRARGGEIRLYGVVPNMLGHRTVCSIVRDIPGVKLVHDHLICFDAVSGAYMPSCEDSCA